MSLSRRSVLTLAAGSAAALALPRLGLAQAAAPSPEVHGLSAFGDLKYPADFAHFDYVDPATPKGGTFSQIGRRRRSTSRSRPSTRSTATF